MIDPSSNTTRRAQSTSEKSALGVDEKERLTSGGGGLTAVQDHPDKDDAQEKVKLEVTLVLVPFEVVPGVGAAQRTERSEASVETRSQTGDGRSKEKVEMISPSTRSRPSHPIMSKEMGEVLT